LVKLGQSGRVFGRLYSVDLLSGEELRILELFTLMIRTPNTLPEEAQKGAERGAATRWLMLPERCIRPYLGKSSSKSPYCDW